MICKNWLIIMKVRYASLLKYWIAILLDFSIKVSVVDAHASIACLFIDYHYGCQVWAN